MMKIPAAATCPANLVSASTSQRSSAMPISTISPPDSSSALATLIPPSSRTLRISGSPVATVSAATIPPNMASPPSRGVGMTCTSRSRGTACAPNQMANRRTDGVSR